MTTTTFVAGMRGVGKSTLLNTYGDRAITIEAEAVQAQAVKLAKGADYPAPYEWEVWDEELRSRAKELLQKALHIIYPGIGSSDKPLLIVGAFLINEWFHQSFIDAITDLFPDHITDQKFYVIHLDAQIISNQIENRGRSDEANFVNNLERIRTERDGYWQLATPKWVKITSHEELHIALGNRI